jgi:hypothetical protein
MTAMTGFTMTGTTTTTTAGTGVRTRLIERGYVRDIADTSPLSGSAKSSGKNTGSGGMSIRMYGNADETACRR